MACDVIAVDVSLSPSSLPPFPLYCDEFQPLFHKELWLWKARLNPTHGPVPLVVAPIRFEPNAAFAYCSECLSSKKGILLFIFESE
jgi:hypothetical protein